MKFLFSLLLCSFVLYAMDNNDSNGSSSFIDKNHADLSRHVKSWGVSIDDMVLGFYNFFGDANNTQILDMNNIFIDINVSYQRNLNLYWYEPMIMNTKGNDTEQNTSRVLRQVVSYNNVDKQNILTPRKIDKEYDEKMIFKGSEESDMDNFFLTRKLLVDRDESYVRGSFLQAYNSLGPDEFMFNIKARVHLTRSRKHLKLFIEDFNDDSAKNIAKTDHTNSPSIGLEQETNKILGITPRYSVGFRGIDPFVRARYSFEKDFGRWNFKPVQTFQYSLKDEASEITEFFLDTSTSENTRLRFVIDRGTNSRDLGMHYDGFIQWFYKPRKESGLSLNFGANGSTRYLNIITNNPLLEEQENRVFNYLFLLRWRENIWKEWLFYELGPGVNYHKRYDYRPNYNISFGIDMFFGHI